MEKISAIVDSLLAGVPNVIMALLLVLLAWVIAKVVRNIIVKGGNKIKLPSYFEKMHIVKDEAAGKGLLSTLGNLGFFIVFLIMIPSVLEKLGMSSVSSPLSGMVASGVGFIPNIIGAGILLFVGYLLSKIAKEVVTSISNTCGVDKLNKKLKGEEDSYSLSELLGNIVFALIIIPTVIAALQALKLHSVANPAVDMLNSMLAVVPNIIVSIIMVMLGLFLAKLVGQIAKSFFVNSGVDKMAKNENLKALFSKYVPSEVFTSIIKFVIVAIFVFQAISALNLTILTNIANAILLYTPNVIGAILILIAAYFAATFASSIIKKVTGCTFLDSLIKVIVYVFALFMTLNQLAIAPQIVNTAFAFIIGALSLAFVLAFGLGGKDFAKKLLDRFERKMH